MRDSMNPDIDIQSLLTETNDNNINNDDDDDTPQNLESPKQSEQQNSSPHVVPKSASPQVLQPSSASSTRTRSRHMSGGTTEERLVILPERRPLPWREGIEPGAENETGGESRRKQIRFGCLLATRGEIQAVPCNSCANGRGKFSVCISLPNFFKGACASCQLSGRPNRCSIKKTDDPIEGHNTIRILNEPHAEYADNAGTHQIKSNSTNTKRRKVSGTNITDSIPAWDGTRRQWEQELGDSPLSQLNTGSRQWATVNRQAASQIIQPVTNNMIRESNATLNTNLHSRLSRSQSSIAQLYDGIEPNGFICQQDRNIDDVKLSREGDNIVLIDTLPKAKQRQVYGLISGIQGGIDHLQRELNSLKNALGIDDKD